MNRGLVNELLVHKHQVFFSNLSPHLIYWRLSTIKISKMFARLLKSLF